MSGKSLLLAALLSVVALVASAQDGMLEELYGRGVHSYFSGNHREAFDALNTAVMNGSRDPRVYYYRALVLNRFGRPDEARDDIRTAVQFEMNSGLPFSVGKALERIQGPERVMLESHRRAARVAIHSTMTAQERARYEQNRRIESEMLRGAAPAVPAAGRAALPADTSDPFAAPMVPAPLPTPATGVAPLPPPAAATPPAATDPFSAPATPAPEAAAPAPPAASDPFSAPATPAPGTPAPATPAPATPAAIDPFSAPATPSAATPTAPATPAEADPFAAPSAAPPTPTPSAPATPAPANTPPSAPANDDPFAAPPAATPATPAPATPAPASEDPFAPQSPAPAPAAPATPPANDDPFAPAPTTPPASP